MINRDEPMKRKLTHPLWTHLPAVAALLVLAGYIIYSSPLPAEAPVHFSFSGVVDAYGSPWLFLGLTIGMSVFFTGLSIFLDELWARQEKKKSFNWFSLLDEVVVGWMTGMSLGYLVALHDNADIFTFPWIYGVVMLGAAIVLAVVLESLRPYRQSRRKPEPKETQDFLKGIGQQLKDDSQFVYWENQNPFYITLLAILMPLIFLASSVLVWVSQGWALYVYIWFAFSVIISISVIAFTFSGQRVMVTRRELTVRWGAVGLKVLRLNTGEMTSLEPMEFSPLKDFGGYGIRYGRGMSAYYLRGNRGVKFTMMNGKKYLVGSDHPERLLTVMELITGKNG